MSSSGQIIIKADHQSGKGVGSKCSLRASKDPEKAIKGPNIEYPRQGHTHIDLFLPFKFQVMSLAP